MLPLLTVTSDGDEHLFRNAITTLADEFRLTDAERTQLLPSGIEPVFENRVWWARTYLKKAGLIQNARRGYFQITDRGRTVLQKTPDVIDVKFLRQFPEFVEFYDGKKSSEDESIQEPQQLIEQTPQELVASGYLKLRKELEADLLARVKACDPAFFERLVVLLLTTMGYGGSLADAGKALGKAGDGGVDGVIKEDKLGLDVLYIQAKRWDSTSVGRPDIQSFVGALHGMKAKKGIFITTSSFTKEAKQYANGLEIKVVLIDGMQLAELMFEYGIGVTTANSYVVKRIDSDFFDEDAPASEAKATARPD
jgi:restriction system protein